MSSQDVQDNIHVIIISCAHMVKHPELAEDYASHIQNAADTMDTIVEAMQGRTDAQAMLGRPTPAPTRKLEVRAPAWHPGANGTVTHIDLPGQKFVDCFYRHSELVKWLKDNGLPQDGTYCDGVQVIFREAK